MQIHLPLIESRKRRVYFDEGYRDEVENVYLDSYDDVIVVRSEITTFFYDRNMNTHFESYLHTRPRTRKDKEKLILMEIEKLAKGTNRATERHV